MTHFAIVGYPGDIRAERNFLCFPGVLLAAMHRRQRRTANYHSFTYQSLNVQPGLRKYRANSHKTRSLGKKIRSDTSGEEFGAVKDLLTTDWALLQLLTALDAGAVAAAQPAQARLSKTV